MALTPVEIRHLQLGRSLRGYSTGTVDRLLAEIADAFEDVWRERADLADRAEQLETDLAQHRETEGLLRATLVSAERSSRELKEQAQRQADTILAEAHAEARTVTRKATGERERLEAEVRRVKALLRSALAAVEEEPAERGQMPEEITETGLRKIVG